MTANWRSRLPGPIPSHPMYEDNASYLAARRPQPRVREEGVVNAELHRGCMDLHFKLQALATGGSILDKPRYRPAALKSKDTTSSSSEGESIATPERTACRARPQTPGQRLSTYRTSQHSIRPSAPPPAVATVDSDVRAIRAELESLRQKVLTKFDSGQRPALVPRTRPEVFDEESQIPQDWVERTRRRREVEEEITYRRSNGDTYHWSSRSPERPAVRFAQQHEEQPSLRAREYEISALRSRERALEEQREKEEELALVKAQRKELQKEERRRKKEAKKREEKEDPDQPDGYWRVPDEERRAMLDLMMTAEAEVRERIARLPVILDTLRARQQKKTLEEALDELQGAIAVYAQRKVFIKNES